jgi:mannose-1-phosphate guanylyltransferase/mannose-6-phosphate isomerase
LHAVILAGGAGERFWPASRSKHPKPFLEVVGGRSLLDATHARARRAASRDGVWVVCGREHAAAVRRATGLSSSRVLVEPERRNTAAAIALAAARIRVEDPEAVMTVLPADHYIPDVEAFEDDIRRAAVAAHGAERLVTLGVKPTRPETGYGYIQQGGAVGRPYARLRDVKRFVEKPGAVRARRFVARGDHLWNAGIFIFSARVILEEIETHVPELHRALRPVLTAGKRLPRATLEQAFRRAPSLPIDVAVMERSDRVWTLPVRWHWNDVGTWESLAGELGVAAGASRVVAGSLLYDDTGGNLVWGRKERPVALLGVEGVAVVDTGDALLVTRLDRSNDVREVVKALKAKGRSDVT